MSTCKNLKPHDDFNLGSGCSRTKELSWLSGDSGGKKIEMGSKEHEEGDENSKFFFPRDACGNFYNTYRHRTQLQTGFFTQEFAQSLYC